MVESESFYESYCSDYKIAVENIISTLDRLETENINVSELHRHFKDAEDVLRSLELQARGLGIEKRREVKQMQNSLRELSKLFDQKLQKKKTAGTLTDEDLQSKAIQKRLNDVTSKIEEGNDLLRDAIRTSNDSGGLGAQILSDLGGQREVLAKTSNNMGVVGSELNSAQGSVKELEKQPCSVM